MVVDCIVEDEKEREIGLPPPFPSTDGRNKSIHSLTHTLSLPPQRKRSPGRREEEEEEEEKKRKKRERKGRHAPLSLHYFQCKSSRAFPLGQLEKREEEREEERVGGGDLKGRWGETTPLRRWNL